MKNLSAIQETETSNREYDLAQLPKSGFNLSYQSQVGGLVLGRYLPMSMTPIMPGDKFSLSNDFSLTLEQLATPLIGDINVSIHNFFITMRSIDKSFEKRMSPNRVNGMSVNDSFPRFDAKVVVSQCIAYFGRLLADVTYHPQTGYVVPSSFRSDWFQSDAAFAIAWNSVFSPLGVELEKSYISDALSDLRDQIAPYLVGIQAKTPEQAEVNLMAALRCWVAFWIGEGSIMDYMQYTILDNKSLDYLNRVKNYQAGDGKFPAVWSEVIGRVLQSRMMCEYVLRACYAIWFEHGRSKDLEPISSTLPDYREFSGSSLIAGKGFQEFAYLLITRYRLWTADAFTTASIDDVSRHVFAPVLSVSQSIGGNVASYATPVTPVDNQGAVGSIAAGVPGGSLSQMAISYRDENGVNRTLSILVPESVSSSHPEFLRSSFSQNTPMSVDLFTIRKARMLERFLKRNSMGDEYRDKMLNQYGARIEDYRINRPQYLSGSVSPLNKSQNVATAATDGAAQGTRLAMATADCVSQDGATMFSPEFGFVISYISLLPIAQYDGAARVHDIDKFVDLPIPVMAEQQEDLMNTSEIARTLLPSGNQNFGHVPYANPWRYRVNSVHGQALSSRANMTFGRFFSMDGSEGTPKLNYQFLHCRPILDMFANKVLLDGQAYGTLKHNFLVERSLPTPIETI